MALVSAGAFNYPTPSKYTATTKTITAGGENLEGEFVGSLVRDDIYTIDMVWDFITPSDWASILALFRDASGGDYAVSHTFYSQDLNAMVTRTMNIGDRKAGMVSYAGDSVMGWRGARMTLTEG